MKGGYSMLKFETGIGDGGWKVLRALSRFRGAAAVVLATLLASACVSPLVQNAPGAMQAAQSRARFELNCPDVQTTVLSQKIVQGWRTQGSEYTIGVRGCGREAVYVTYCRDENDCNALSQTGRINTLANFAPPGLNR
jgi:hypothetical protein